MYLIYRAVSFLLGGTATFAPISHLRANTMFEAGAMPPLFRAAQKVSLASTGELNLGSSSTMKSASLPGCRWTCARIGWVLKRGCY